MTENDELRKRAEENLARMPAPTEALSPGEALRTLHELRVHQIELEMQNEELRRAQAELEAARARYFDLYDLAPAGYCTLSEKGLILEVNLVAATLLGVERKSLVKQPISRFIHPEDQDIYYRHRNRLFETGAPQACEFRMLRRDGAPFWARLDAAAVRDADGALVCHVAMSDITERKRMEEALRESREALNLILDTVPQSIFWKDLEGRYLGCNRVFAAAVGLDDPARIAGKTDFDLPWPRAEAEAYRADDREVIATNRPKLHIVEPLQQADGARLWIDTSKAPLRDANGRPFALLGVYEDITDRRRMEEALRASEKKYRLVVDNASEVIIVVQDGMLRFVNPALVAMLGFSEQELKSKPFPSFVHPDDRAMVVERHQKRLRGETVPTRYTFRAITKDGNAKWTEASAVGIEWEGRPATLGFLSDITERKRADEALRASEAQKNAILNGISANIALVDKELKILWANKAAGVSVKKAPEELVGHPCYSFWGDPAKPCANCPTVKAFQTKQSEHIIVKTPDGRIWDEGGEPVLDPQGNVIAIVEIAQDITEGKKMQDIQIFLAETSTGTYNRPFFEALAQYLAQTLGMDFVCIDRLEGDGLTARTVAVWCDGHFEDNVTYALKDTPCGEVVGKTVCCFPASVCQFFPRDRVLQDLRAESYVGVTLFSHTRQPIGLIAVIGRRPLANRPLAEAALKLVAIRAAGELERLEVEEDIKRKNEEMVRFAYTVSHDLKSPLVTIKTFLGYLVDDVKARNEKAQAEDVGYIRNAADKMENLLDELLELSRIGRKTSPPQEIPLQAVAQSAIDLVSGRLSKAGVKMSVTDLPVLLYGDVQRLEELYQNLVDNAVKFMGDQPEPRIEIGALREDAKIALFVRDNGVGIDPRCQKKLFGLFEKMDKNTEGVGMGLAIVKRIVEVHGGEIRAESEGLGKGTTFWFTLAGTRLKDKG